MCQTENGPKFNIAVAKQICKDMNIDWTEHRSGIIVNGHALTEAELRDILMGSNDQK